jgi:hypothetical protein
LRILVTALLVLGLVLPASGAARLASRSWATGVITRVSSATIAVRGSVSLTFLSGNGATAKSTLDGTRLLTCSVGRASVVRGYRVGNKVSITCDGGVLSHIARGG